MCALLGHRQLLDDLTSKAGVAEPLALARLLAAPRPLWHAQVLVVLAVQSLLRHPAVLVDRLGQVLEIRC